jgi:hypothetical protein
VHTVLAVAAQASALRAQEPLAPVESSFSAGATDLRLEHSVNHYALNGAQPTERRT